MRQIMFRALLLVFTIFFSTSAFAGSGKKIKWFEVEEATIHYDVSGTQTGKMVRHHKEWGAKQSEVSQTTMNMMGMSFPAHEKTIIEGEWITNVDLNKKTATRVKNPNHDYYAKLKGDKSGVEAGKEYMRSMGGGDTGKTAKYAGEKCSIWKIPNTGALTCVTQDGLNLWTEINMGGTKIVQTATKVERGNPGPKKAYEIDAGIEVKTHDNKQMDEMMKMMRQGRGSGDRPMPPGAGDGPPGENMPDMQKLMKMLQQQRQGGQ